MRRLAGLAVATAVGLAWGVVQGAGANRNVLFVFDASGSMRTAAGTDTRIAAAKRAMGRALADMPRDVKVGLMMYGHRRAKDCTDIELVSAIGSADAAAVNRRIQAVQPKGETPIAETLRQAAQSFAALRGQRNSIVLVTDGIEECRGDPCAAADAIRAAGLDVRVHVVGLALTEQQRRAVQCIPDATGGKYFAATDAGSLGVALAEAREQAAPAELDLLRPGNGGHLVAAPAAEWEVVLSGRETDAARVGLGREAIFGFKDGRAATFAAFSMLVPARGAYIREFELLAGDDAGGPFRALGRFTTQNMRVIESPYQRFTFAETTARFLMLRTLSAHDVTPGGFHLLPQIRLMGQLAPAASTVVPVVSRPPLVNLLSPANGGTIVKAGDPEWKDAVSGADAARGRIAAPNEAIFAFRDGRPATFSAFATLISETNAYVREFELLAADVPDGPYRSIRRFVTTNALIVEAPYQSVQFDPVTARFVKVRLISAHGVTPGGFSLLGQIRLMGYIR